MTDIPSNPIRDEAPTEYARHLERLLHEYSRYAVCPYCAGQQGRHRHQIVTCPVGVAMDRVYEQEIGRHGRPPGCAS